MIDRTPLYLMVLVSYRVLSRLFGRPDISIYNDRCYEMCSRPRMKFSNSRIAKEKVSVLGATRYVSRKKEKKIIIRNSWKRSSCGEKNLDLTLGGDV